MSKTVKGLKPFNSDAYLTKGYGEMLLLSLVLIGLLVSAWFLWRHYESQKKITSELSFSYEKDSRERRLL